MVEVLPKRGASMPLVAAGGNKKEASDAGDVERMLRLRKFFSHSTRTLKDGGYGNAYILILKCERASQSRSYICWRYLQPAVPQNRALVSTHLRHACTA